MQDILQPLIHKAAVMGLQVNVTRSGLCIGDPAELHLLEGGQIGIFAKSRKRWLGVLPHRGLLHLGQLGPAATAILAVPMAQAQHLRVRIVGLTPEHLSAENGPEVFISVWGNLPMQAGPAMAGVRP